MAESSEDAARRLAEEEIRAYFSGRGESSPETILRDYGRARERAALEKAVKANCLLCAGGSWMGEFYEQPVRLFKGTWVHDVKPGIEDRLAISCGGSVIRSLLEE